MQNTQIPLTNGKAIIRTRSVFPQLVNDFGNICDHADSDFDIYNP